jgi:hypothetical protein
MIPPINHIIYRIIDHNKDHVKYNILSQKFVFEKKGQEKPIAGRLG